jgi:hypothetical protein
MKTQLIMKCKQIWNGKPTESMVLVSDDVLLEVNTYEFNLPLEKGETYRVIIEKL